MFSNAYCYINGKLIDIVKGSVTFDLDKIGEFEIEIPAQSIDYRDIRGSDVIVFVNGEQYISGFAIERPSFKYMDTENIILSVKCYDELGRLGCIRSKTDAFYQDTLVTSILTNLLLLAPSWNLNFSSYSQAATEVTTIDLRDKETLFAQIISVIESVPSLHLRFGGYTDSGNPILDVGNFDQLRYEGQQGFNISELSLDANSNRIYNEVEAFGGFSAEERITLADSLNDPRTSVHPDFANYPIVNAGGFYVVRNLSLDNACGISKKFELHKTENNEKPTQTEINEAAYALWRKSVRFLQKTDDYEVYSCQYLSTNRPLVGDRIFINARVIERSFDEFSLCWNEIPVASVESDFKITSVKTSLESFQAVDEFSCGDSPNLLMYELQLTSGEDYEEYDSEMELYDRLDKSQQVNSGNVLQISPIVTLTVNHTGAEASDCSSPSQGITSGKQFVFNPTNQPTWATKIFYALSSSIPNNIRYYVVQYDENDINLPIILCVADSSGQWLLATDITVNLLIYYS